ncbi:MAG TPA: beta-ketoacyl-ACP synthase III [Rhizomicrobium sp.]|nr:beta-ketoacyl-ACP synthase III [Rhizomicrobium sp.]
MAISGTGVFTPSQRISNAELVVAFNAFVSRHNERHAAEIDAGTMPALLKSSEEFIVKASGIRNRYVLTREGMLDPEIMCPRLPQRADNELSYSAEIGIAAAKAALEAACRTPKDIGAVIVAASIMERPYPQIAIEIQNALGIEGMGFDMLAGCSSAAFGIRTAAALVGQGAAKAALVISPEICTSHLNLRDRETHFIFGDAASAVVVERADGADGGNCWEIVGTRLKSIYSNNLRNNFGPLNRFAPERIGEPDKLITQMGRKVFKEVVPMVAEFMTEHLAETRLNSRDVKRLWLHQANINMNELIARKVLGREAEPGESPNILAEYGNTSSAGSIIAFNRHSDDLQPGDIGHLCAFGAGYTAGSVVLRKMH